MIERLWVQNFALIENSEVEFGSGLNIITGETGAGKSIFIGAISALMGKKTEGAAILNPDKKTIIEATFLIKPHQIPDTLWQELDLPPSDEIIVRREISPQGKSRYFIHDTPVNQALLKEVIELLIELHGQHEGQKILSKDFQLTLLDQYGNLDAPVKEYQQLYQELKDKENLLNEMKLNAQKVQERIEFLRFQLQDFEAYELIEKEDEEIEAQVKVLENAQTIQNTLQKACFVLYESDKSVYVSLANVERVIDKISHLAPVLQGEKQKLVEASALIAEASQNFKKFSDSIDADPSLLEKLNEKLNFYNRLKKKYNVMTVSELLQIRQHYRQELSRLGHHEQDITVLSGEIERLGQQLMEKGEILERRRQEVALELSQKVNEYLEAVALPNAEFGVEFTKYPKPQKKGLSEVNFLIRTNVGVPMGPLSQVASGGEISRIMLAIKAALAQKMELSSLIFDEIDTGISGEVALKVGKVMEELSQKFQVITITHLPQMASRHGKHFLIYKEVVEGKTYSRIKPLDEQERVFQIAKMLYGENPPSSAIENAKTLLQTQSFNL